MRKLRALDLFCGAGGASRGLADAGFDVTGVDIEPQPRYPFAFYLRNAFEIPKGGFDLIWASPPCQRFTAYKRRPNHVAYRPDLIPAVRAHFAFTEGTLTVIENVPGAPLLHPITLCGSMFGLDVRRHRLFESNFPIPQPKCHHEKQRPRFPQATNRKNLRRTVEVGVWRIPLRTQQRAMGIDWMQLEELSEAIPPAYAEHIGRAAIAALQAKGAA